jgi:hypothetical protein
MRARISARIQPHCRRVVRNAPALPTDAIAIRSALHELDEEPILLRMPPSFAEAIHLVPSAAACGGIRQTGGRGTRVYESGDRLTSGPCAVDPIRHEELRNAWDTDGWKRRLSLDRLRDAVDGADPIVVWATRAFTDLVWLCWALHSLDRVRADASRVYLARPDPGDPRMEVGCSNSEQQRIALAAANPVTGAPWRDGVDLWIRFASASPLAFDEARRSGSSAFPELSSAGELHGAWFPRELAGRLQLAELDEVLLRGVDDSWRTPAELIGALSEDTLVRLLGSFDDNVPVYRLRAWANHGAIEHEPVANDKYFAQDRFRATDRTRALLRHGLDAVGDAPTQYVGGCVVNDPASPWVRIDGDSGWRLALQGGRTRV